MTANENEVHKAAVFVHGDVLEAVESASTVFELVALFPATAQSVALQFRLCQRLLQFPQDELAFWLPQLVHVYVTVSTDSCALEDLLLDMSARNPHFALAVFWFVQSSLSDLRPDPHSYGFAAAKRLVNKLQHMLFAVGELPQDTQMHENTEPALVLAAVLCAAVGMPSLAKHMKPLIESQGRKQRSAYLHRLKPERQHNSAEPEHDLRRKSVIEESFKVETEVLNDKVVKSESVERTVTFKDPFSKDPFSKDPFSKEAFRDGELAHLGLVQMGSQPNLAFAHGSHSTDALTLVTRRNRSMPDLHLSETPVNRLKTNYFRCETQLVHALISISNRLLQVPKEARQSALQVELALLNEDLPNAQVDLPMLLPQQRGEKQNRLVRICVQEATVLNSAEKAPFLLLIEYLRGDLNFDPLSQRNRELLRLNRQSTHIFERPTLARQQLGKAALKKEEMEAEVNVEKVDEIDISEVGLLEREDFFKQESGTGLPVANIEINGANHVQDTQQHAEGPSPADLATQLRAASVILAQLDGNTKLPRHEAHLIKQRVLESMQQMKSSPGERQGVAGERRLENDMKLSGLSSVQENEGVQINDEEDPSAANLGEDWQSRRARIRRASQFGHLPNWDLVSVIVKTGDDLRQEALASQLIQRASQLWKQHGVGVWVRRMMILITSANSGLVETITNALSLHSIKKALTTAEVNARTRDARTIAQLKQHFRLKFGPETGSRYRQALNNFVASLAGYSVLCYLLQIKDRHNGNILLDADGHIIHIDFGFMLSNSPGHIGFEANTFKLTQEYVDLMGGVLSPYYLRFVELSTDAFLALRNHTDEFCSFMEIMGTNSTLPCFKGGAQLVSQQLRQRLMPDISENEAREQFAILIKKSENNIYTRMYDQFQLITQGIYN